MAENATEPKRSRLGGLLRDLATPLTVAIVGLLASIYVNNKQSLEANQRAFAEPINQREGADTKLRIQMFKTVLQGFPRSARGQSRGRCPTPWWGARGANGPGTTAQNSIKTPRGFFSFPPPTTTPASRTANAAPSSSATWTMPAPKSASSTSPPTA